MRDLGAKVNPSMSIKIYFQHVHSIRAMKGIRLFIYFGRTFSTYETEDGPDVAQTQN